MSLANARRVALVLWIGVAAAIAFELGGFQSPWRVGGQLYFPRAPGVVLAIDRESLSEDHYLQALASDRTVEWVLLISDGLEERVVDALTTHGYREGDSDGSRYRVFHRNAP